jgi:hypothetical protein
VWGGNVSPSLTSSAAVAAAAAAAFTAQGWLGQIPPTAPPGQLPASSLWGLHGKDVKTEQQIVVSNRTFENTKLHVWKSWKF